MAVDAPDELTIDQLAARTGMTVRNIRAHQSRGLLAPPTVRGRTGYYGPDHVERLELIKELQADGYNLDLIRRLVEGAGGRTGEVLRFTRAVREPFVTESPEPIDVVKLAETWGTADPGLFMRAIEVGLIRQREDGRYEAVSPRLVAAGGELASVGVSPAEALELFGKLREQADAIARSFVELFLEHVWAPFDAAGQPEERWPEIQATLERLRPLAMEGVVAVFGVAMSEVVEQAFGRELQRLGEDAERRP